VVRVERECLELAPLAENLLERGAGLWKRRNCWKSRLGSGSERCSLLYLKTFDLVFLVDYVYVWTRSFFDFD